MIELIHKLLHATCGFGKKISDGLDKILSVYRYSLPGQQSPYKILTEILLAYWDKACPLVVHKLAKTLKPIMATITLRETATGI